MNKAWVPTKVGWILLGEEDGKIVECGFREKTEESEKLSSLLQEASKQLQEYLDGKRKAFSLPLEAKGTPFQKRVWKELQRIPYGECISYGELAKRIGNPKAARAVGMANHNNPIGIIIPCHRVIGKNGKLVGYAGGMDKKAYLLELEKSVMQKEE